MGSNELLGSQGFTSTLYLVPGDPPRVCKAFDKESANKLYAYDKLYASEKAAYERFAANDPPSSILQYYGVHESIPAAITLELAERHDLLRYLSGEEKCGRPRPDNTLLYRWAMQAVEALEFAHSLDVYNGDIHCINFFLDQDLNLKVGDWAGASIDGGKSYSSYRLRHRLFDADGTDIPRKTGITATTEVFALGTALYCMVAGHAPWPELREPEDREEIKNRICRKDFPDTSQLPVLADVILKCWHVEFHSMKAVRLAIEAEAGM